MPDGPAAIPFLPVERIYLTGFMGAGKSTIGPILAAHLDWQFLDTDHLIEQKTSSTVAELFRLHGEPHFRSLEYQTIRETSSSQNTIIALGGGSLEVEGVRETLMRDHRALIIYLEAPLSTLLDRCAPTGQVSPRPLLAQASTLQTRLERRLPLYESSHLTVSTQQRTPDEAVAIILEFLRQKDYANSLPRIRTCI